MSSYRSKALETHGDQCQNCGSDDGIEIHHLNGDRNDNSMENLVPLCRPCHRNLHRSGLDGLEALLKPVSERSHIDQSKTTFQFSTRRQLWEEWKNTIPRTKSLETRIIELIEADLEENRVDE